MTSANELLSNYKGMYKLVKEVRKMKKQNKPYGENKKAAGKRKG